MDKNNLFDRAVEARFNPAACQGQDSRELIGIATGGRAPEDVRDVAIFLTDTVDLFWKAAQAIFGTKARPEHALAMFDQSQRLIDRVEPSWVPTVIKPCGVCGAWPGTQHDIRAHASLPPAAPMVPPPATPGPKAI